MSPKSCASRSRSFLFPMQMLRSALLLSRQSVFSSSTRSEKLTDRSWTLTSSVYFSQSSVWRRFASSPGSLLRLRSEERGRTQSIWSRRSRSNREDGISTWSPRISAEREWSSKATMRSGESTVWRRRKVVVSVNRAKSRSESDSCNASVMSADAWNCESVSPRDDALCE